MSISNENNFPLSEIKEDNADQINNKKQKENYEEDKLPSSKNDNVTQKDSIDEAKVVYFST